MTERSDTTAGRWIFTVAVAAAVASAVLAYFTTGWEASIRFGILAVVMVLVRNSGVPAPFAAAFAVFLLLATWASVRHWYRQVEHFDLVVHVLTPGSLAAAAYFVLVHHRLLPSVQGRMAALRPAAPVLWVTVVGVTAAVLWEFYEWGVEQYAPGTMIVGYTDTILDLAAGMLGSAVAGLLAVHWARNHDDAPWAPAPSSARVRA